jgi:hypothetical protein
MIKIHDPDHVEVYIRNGCILMHTAKNEQFNIAYDQW